MKPIQRLLDIHLLRNMNQNTGNQDNLRFDGVKFHAVHFEILGEPKEDEDIDLDISPKVSYLSDSLFNIVFDVNMEISEVFKLSLIAVGYFELSKEILETPNIKEQVIHANAPAMVFPYIRSFISTFTANLGTIPALTIPTHFFKGNLEEIKD